MTTQHQAPEVTSELVVQADRDAAAGFGDLYGILTKRGAESIRDGHDDHHFIVQAFAAHRRATQPLSLTVDEGIVEAVATAIWENDCATYLPVQWENDPDHWRRYARAALDRLQSLSLPVDIDRSGLAQEVE